MEIYLTERPGAPLAALAPMPAVRVIPGAGVPSRPQVHQVPVQAELVRVPASEGNDGINGFAGKDVLISTKQRMDVRGVPPRGRPV
jgi:hypothetical protein